MLLLIPRLIFKYIRYVSFPDKAITVDWTSPVLKWKLRHKIFLNVYSNHAVIVLIMYLTTVFALVPLLLDMNKASAFLSNIFITEFENAVSSWIKFGCLYVDEIYFFCSARVKVLEAKGAIQTSLLIVVWNPETL